MIQAKLSKAEKNQIEGIRQEIEKIKQPGYTIESQIDDARAEIKVLSESIPGWINKAASANDPLAAYDEVHEARLKIKKLEGFVSDMENQPEQFYRKAEPLKSQIKAIERKALDRAREVARLQEAKDFYGLKDSEQQELDSLLAECE